MKYLVLLLLPFNALADAVPAIWWTHPIQRENNAPYDYLTETLEYKVYESTGAWVKNFPVWGQDGERGYIAWWQASEEPFCVYMTTTDNDGREGGPSNELCFQFLPDAPVISCQ